MLDIIWMGAVLPVLLVLSALASGTETALFTLNHRERAAMRRDHPAAGRAVDRVLSRPRRLLVLVLLGNTTVNVSYFIVTSTLSARIGREAGLSAAASGGVSLAAGVASVLLVVLLGEVLAKVLAARERVRLSRLMAPVLVGLDRALGPVVVVLDTLVVGPLSRVVLPSGAVGGSGSGGPAAAGRGDDSADDLTALLAAAADAGDVDDAEQRLLESVVELGRVRVMEVMTPRDQVDWVDVSAGPAEVQRVGAQRGHVRLPVARGGLDGGVVGVLDVSGYLSELGGRANPASVGSSRHVRPAVYLPETARLDAALEQLRRVGRAHALCVDERGAITGLVSVGTIAQALVRGAGEAARTGPGRVQMVGLGRWLVPGRLGVRAFEELFEGSWAGAEGAGAAGGAATLGGLIVQRLGRLATVGDSVRVGGLRLSVESVRGRGVDLVLVEVPMAGGGDGVG